MPESSPGDGGRLELGQVPRGASSQGGWLLVHPGRLTKGRRQAWYPKYSTPSGTAGTDPSHEQVLTTLPVSTALLANAG